MKKIKTQFHWSAAAIVIFVILSVYVIVLFLPLLWGLLTSFKSDFDFRNNVFGLPEEWLWSNYSLTFLGFYTDVEWAGTFRNVFLPEQFGYSILYSAGCALAATYVPCHVGYLTAKFKYRFSRILTAVVIVCITLPVVGALPSEIQMARLFGLYDQVWGMWIMKANFLSMYLLIFQAMFRGVPDDFSEAAKIDGASNLRVYANIMLPLVAKTFLTVYLLNFIAFWNDYQTPLIFMPNKPTVAFGLYTYNRRTEGEYSTIPLKLAGSILVLLPVLTVFLVFQKRLMGNITMGGLK